MGDTAFPESESSGDRDNSGARATRVFDASERQLLACACEIAVTPTTGAIAVEKVTRVVDPGIVVNPLQLKRQVEGGSMMGISQALYEEVACDQSGVTTQDWLTYPILKTAEIPDIKVVLIHNPEVGTGI